MERGMYQYRCYHASHDEDCMHTTVDGSDQTAFGLPHFPQDDKVTSEGFKYKVRLLLNNERHVWDFPHNAPVFGENISFVYAIPSLGCMVL